MADYRETMKLFSQIKKEAYEKCRPIQATFELTPRCGLDCKMCYVHLHPEEISKCGRGRELTAAEWIEMGRQAQVAGVFSLCITGGDPVLHPEFETIWKELSRMGFRITLQTNAYSITERLEKLFYEYPPQEAKITLYGSNDEVYRNVCRVENGFTKVNEGIQKLRSLNIPIQLVTTFVKQNIEDRDNIFKYALTNRYRWYYSTSCYPSLRGANTNARECALSIYDLGCSEEASREWNENPVMKMNKKPCEYCSIYRTGYNITWDGYMRFCLFLNEPKIDILAHTFEENWRMLQEYSKGIRWPEKCYTCQVRDKCRKCIASISCYNGGKQSIIEDYCQNVIHLLGIKN